MKKLYWLGLVLCYFSSYASDDTSPFGEVAIAELESTFYAPDSTAEAAILRDKGSVRIIYDDHLGFRAFYTREVKIKIYRSSGLSWGDVVLPYYVKDKYKAERIDDIEANTYNLEEGRIQKTELTKDAVFTEDMDESWNLRKFALPNVREGSVIEYTYTLVSPYLFHLRDWQFQYEVPVVWSEYSATIPAFYEYLILHQGYVPLAESEAEMSRHKLQLRQYTYNNAKYFWASEHIPAFADESFISNKEDYISKLTFQLAKENFPGRAVREYMETWPKLAGDLLSLTDYGRFLKRKDGKETVEELTAGLTSDLEKAQAIYGYLGQHLRWNEEYSLYPEGTPKSLLESRVGNSSDLTAILTNWLRMADIDANPVMVSTRGHGRVQVKFPVIDQFNTSVVYAKIENQEYLLDITDPYQPFGVIPIQCLNGYGLVVDTKEERWVALERVHRYHTENYLSVIYNFETSQFETTVNQVYRGYAALAQRQQLRDEPKEVVGYQMEDFRVINQEKTDEDLRMTFTQLEPAVDLGDYLYVETFPKSPFAENPFKAAERQHPIDYSYRRTYKQVFNLVIPEGYAVEEVPTSTTASLEGNVVQFVFQPQVSAVSVQVMSIIRINQSLVDAQQYQELRKLYEDVLVKHQEKIVLRKIK